MVEQTVQTGIATPRQKRRRGLAIAALVLAVAAVLIAFWVLRPPKPIVLSGAVLTQDADPHKQVPLAGVAISAADANGSVIASTTSGPSGGFHLTLSRWFRMGRPLVLGFRHAGYQSLQLKETVADRIYIARMTPSVRAPSTESGPNATRVANVLLRYTTNETTNVNIGSVAKTFEVVNRGDVPCNIQPSSSAGTAPEAAEQCSPDGKWKAAAGNFSLDAGEGNQFRDIRVSCIAGPCPFTRIEDNSSSQGGRMWQVSVLNWSDTTTFLVEAEVFHPMVSDVVRNSHPVIFGRVLSFTLPADAEGPSLEAEIGGNSIVFPLGPKLTLSWATCTTSGDGRNRSYHCELKPGYRF